VTPDVPEAVAPDLSPPDVPMPGRDSRRPPLKPRISAPRPPAALQNPPPASNAPVVSQQVAPLPPPIEVRPAPGVLRPAPKPKPPLVLTPPLANP
jgi:large subunit ribosomal protein L24